MAYEISAFSRPTKRLATLGGAMAFALLALFACDSSDDDGVTPDAGTPDGQVNPETSSPNIRPDAEAPVPKADPGRDVVSTKLALDFGKLTGVATITIAKSDSLGLSLAAGDLDVTSVKLATSGTELKFEVNAGTLIVGIPAQNEEPIAIAYAFKSHDDALKGFSLARGNTWLWPTHCQYLFPCKTFAEDGVTFELEVTGLPAEQIPDGGFPDGATESFKAIYPPKIPFEVPSYVPGFAFGRYAEKSIGKSQGGVDLVVWWRPGIDDEANVDLGVSRQLFVFDFFETKYGPYKFGTKAGGVMVDWPSYGGMEHHPYWHVNAAFARAQTAGNHEVGHAWFGDGVRPKCAEDFVLSEGTVTYMTGHALEKHPSPPVPAIFDHGPYCGALRAVCDGDTNTIVMPTTCGAVDLSKDTEKLGGDATYYKGAYFYYEVAQAVGADKLDEMLGSFYKAHVGKAARMEDMIAHLKTESGESATIDALATAWLKTLACPARADELCPPTP